MEYSTEDNCESTKSDTISPMLAANGAATLSGFNFVLCENTITAVNRKSRVKHETVAVNIPEVVSSRASDHLKVPYKIADIDTANTAAADDATTACT